MKKQLLKKRSVCLPVGMVFMVTAMLFSVSAKAQIVYTDVIPDTTINTNGGVYALDLNNDGITDFNITYSTTIISATCGGTPHTSTNINIRITPLGVNAVGNDPTYPSALLLNSLIDSSSFTWLNNVNQILTYKYWHCIGFGMSHFWIASYTGHWNGAVDKYIPLRLYVGSQKYYGWVRLNVDSPAVRFTVKDYGYNSIPNQPILAGQTTVTGVIENSFASSINFFPNPANNHLTIALGSNNKKVQVTIADITGKVIYTTIATDTQKVEVNTKDFAEGIYVVQIQAVGFIGTKKLVVEK